MGEGEGEKEGGDEEGDGEWVGKGKEWAVRPSGEKVVVKEVVCW